MIDPETPDTAPPPPDAAAAAAAHAREARLRYVNATDPGIRRERNGDDWHYFGPDNAPVTDEATLTRIRMLAIPPAYVNVWICVQPRGHLQCTGLDARGRRQYRYHKDWRTTRDGVKFERMIEFGEALPRLHRRLRRDLALPGLPQQKVLAVVVTLLDSTLVRVGNVEYARDNKSYGLTTLRDRHVKFIRDGRAVMQFRGKGGVVHDITVNDRRLARVMRHCQALPGQHLFKYIGDDGAHHQIDSDQVNDYLAEAMGAEFTAKDFRTWGATERAIALMSATPLPEPVSETALTACIVAAVKQVALELRNTPAVCRKSYINPVVFAAWRAGRLHDAIPPDASSHPRKAERAALKFLRAEARVAASVARRGKKAA
jgi:DNA topoisomerase IB